MSGTKLFQMKMTPSNIAKSMVLSAHVARGPVLMFEPSCDSRTSAGIGAGELSSRARGWCKNASGKSALLGWCSTRTDPWTAQAWPVQELPAGQDAGLESVEPTPTEGGRVLLMLLLLPPPPAAPPLLLLPSLLFSTLLSLLTWCLEPNPCAGSAAVAGCAASFEEAAVRAEAV